MPEVPPASRAPVPAPPASAVDAAETALPLAALVFHCGRCGSTLLARLFAADPANRVCLEPDALRSFMRRHRGQFDRADVGAEFRSLLLAHGRAPTAGERRLVVKLNSTSTVLAREIGRVFPGVPLIYLLRDPAEVVASLLAWAPPFLAPGNREPLAAVLGGAERAPSSYSQVEWLAWYVGRNLQLAWERRDVFAEAIDYGELSPRYLDLVNRISRTSLAAHDPAIAQVLTMHSKYPEQAFSRTADSARVPDGLAEIVAPFARVPYARWLVEIKARPAAAGAVA